MNEWKNYYENCNLRKKHNHISAGEGTGPRGEEGAGDRLGCIHLWSAPIPLQSSTICLTISHLYGIVDLTLQGRGHIDVDQLIPVLTRSANGTGFPGGFAVYYF